MTQGRSGKRFFLVLNVNREKVTAMRATTVTVPALPLSHINRVFENIYPLKDSPSSRPSSTPTNVKINPSKNPKFPTNALTPTKRSS